MCNSVLVLLLVALCSTPLVLGENISGDKEKVCTLPDRSPGVCRPSSECPRSASSSITCSTQTDIVYVCCEPAVTGSPSHNGTRRTTESPRKVERDGVSRIEDGTNDDKITDRFFYEEPIVGDWQNKWQYNYNYNYHNKFKTKEEGRKPFRDINVHSFDIVPDFYNLEETEEEKNEKYPWNSNRRRSERPYNPGYNNYEEKEDQKYPWNSDRRTTQRPYNPGYNNYEEKEDQKYPWNSDRRTTQRPYNPGYNNYEEKEDQKYPWNSDRRTTERPSATRRTTVSPPKKQTPDPNGFLYFSDNMKRKRISEIKCDEYSEIVTQTVMGLPLVPNPSPIEIKVDKCKNVLSLIVGGKDTSVGEFPHMAAVGFFDAARRQTKWQCGGSLISERYVLTAAHCAISSLGKPVKVRLGDYNLKKDDDGAHPEDYPIAEIVVHPDYERSRKYNDIALLRLSRSVNIKKDIRPACLHTGPTINQSSATAIGWGRVERAGSESDILQKVTLNLIDKDSCRKAYSNDGFKVYLPRGIIDSQLCAGELTGTKDTCQGDSGGPLEILSDGSLCVHYIIGITSFGKSCGIPNSPGVYTKVSSYISWIESVVWPGQ